MFPPNGASSNSSVNNTNNNVTKKRNGLFNSTTTSNYPLNQPPPSSTTHPAPYLEPLLSSSQDKQLNNANNNCKSFVNFTKKYSMNSSDGGGGVETSVRLSNPGPMTMNSGTKLNPPESNCCFGLIHLQAGAILIALLELVFFIYQIFICSKSYDKTGDEYAFAFILTLFSFALAIVAVILLLFGVPRKSPYFLVPHLLMQFAIICSTFLLTIYLILLWIGGTSVQVDLVFYEDSPRGELGLTQINRYLPIRQDVVLTDLNFLLIGLIILTTIFLFIQIIFLWVVKRCYNLLRYLSMEKPTPVFIDGTMSTAINSPQNQVNP